MRHRTNGESRERLRQLLHAHARRLGLTQAAVESLVRSAKLDRWSPGDEIVSTDDGHDLVTFLVVGAAKILCPTPRGDRVTVAFAAPGHFIATGWLLDDRPVRRAFSAIAHDPLGTTVAAWSRTVMTDVIAALPPPQALQLMSYGWRAFSSLVRLKCQLLALPLRDRVLSVLQILARDFGMPHELGVRVELRLTHLDIAGIAVGSRANVTRALDGLREHGLVARDGHRLVITRRGLAELRGDDEGFRDAPPPPAVDELPRRAAL